MPVHSQFLPVDTPLGEKQIHFTQWGNDSHKPTLVCSHGFIRNCHDFDVLAGALSNTYQVVCLDAPGRGKSDWLNETLYHQENYVQLALQVLDQLGIKEFHWLGTSMGGITGCTLAAKAPKRVKSLILNDVGAVIDGAGVTHVKTYAADKPVFATLTEAEHYFRNTYQAFGTLDDSDWQHMTAHSVKQSGNTYILHYDPALGDMALHFPENDMEYWGLWAAVKCPTLILRGQNSLYLRASTVSQMCQQHPTAYAVHIPKTGHAPGLTKPDQIQLIEYWLDNLYMPSKEQNL